MVMGMSWARIFVAKSASTLTGPVCVFGIQGSIPVESQAQFPFSRPLGAQPVGGHRAWNPFIVIVIALVAGF